MKVTQVVYAVAFPEVCQMSTSLWMVFNLLHLPWTSTQLAVYHWTTKSIDKYTLIKQALNML